MPVARKGTQGHTLMQKYLKPHAWFSIGWREWACRGTDIGKRHGLVKVVTGLRRCGKTYLLNELYRNWLLS